MTRIGLGSMLFGIRSQFVILVVMLVSSTGLTLGLACVCTHKCTYTNTGKSDSQIRDDHILHTTLRKGVPYKYVRVNKRMLASSLKSLRPMVGVSPKAIIRIAVQGCILCSAKITNGNSLRVILSLQVRSVVESDPILALPRGRQYPYYRGANQADVCYCINFQVDMEVNMGMYNEVQST